MIKKLIKYFLYLILLAVIGIAYLSYLGIETKRFNQIITEKITEKYKSTDVKLNEVKIILDLSSLGLALETKNPSIAVEKKEIKIKKIKTNFSIDSIFRKEFVIKNIKIITDKNDLKNLVKIVRTFQNTPQLFIFSKILKKGSIIADVEINFEQDGKMIQNYKVKGSVYDAKLNLFNKKKINNISFNFDIDEKKYLIKNSKIEYEKLNFTSKKIRINKEKKYFLFEGDISNSLSKINLNIFNDFFQNNLNNLNLENLELSSDNSFSFRLENKFKVSNLKINSNTKVKNLNYLIKDYRFKEYFPDYDNSITLSDHLIQISIDKRKINIKGSGNFSLAKEIDTIDYEIFSDKKNYKFKTNIDSTNISLKIPALDYSKKENINSLLTIEGSLKKNQSIIFSNLLFKENNNYFQIKGLNLNKNYKITHIEKIDLNYINNNKKNNQIVLTKNKKNYELSGKTFDAANLINKILFSDEEGNFFIILNNFNSNIKVNIDKVYVHEDDFLKNLTANLKFTKSELKNLNLKGDFSNNKKFTLTVKTNQNNEKTTTLFSDNAEPLVKKYKFIKGFDEGYLDFYSVKKNNISNSVLKINDFKLKELPALTKILTLASLQGIADLLTGEGIRFIEFEMKFRNEKKLMTIDEIYAIGPAISILIDGYVQSDELISLSGTLVPATTLNKVIGSIPLLGNILVGKKIGEGVFGVSFKIKGPPKHTKTTVNPIKTLTPRFITRTLEKIKESN